MANLAGNQLYKHDWRVAIFIKKYLSEIPFDLVGGNKIKFVSDKTVVEALTKKIPTSRLPLLGHDGKSYAFKDLLKTPEFGGRTIDNLPTARENEQLSALRRQIDQAKIQQCSSTINLLVDGKSYAVSQAVSTPGTPKSDFHLVDNDGNEVVWISHKAGKSPTDFQQWGGVSKSREPNIFSHPETQAFINDLKSDFPIGLPRRTSVFRRIKDSRLKMMSVYGNKFQSAPLGRQNVSMVAQGNLRLKPHGARRCYEITANQVHCNGETMTGDYDPVLLAANKLDVDYDPVFMATYKGDRSDAGIKGTRIVIAPIGGRKATEYQPHLK